MTKTLYANDVFHDGAISITRDSDSLVPNWRQIGMKIGANMPTYFEAGKYLGLHLNDGPKIITITFLDFRKNDAACNKLIHDIKFDQESLNRVLDLIQSINSKYDEVKDDYKIVEGNPPNNS